mmetsp:Transcript_40965/g.101834  ORF Transcript_40965/g.101834 Transcript_40965/m.101834 type:complete len:100 (-) Transcript_40965:184-483(-)
MPTGALEKHRRLSRLSASSLPEAFTIVRSTHARESECLHFCYVSPDSSGFHYCMVCFCLSGCRDLLRAVVLELQTLYRHTGWACPILRAVNEIAFVDND